MSTHQNITGVIGVILAISPFLISSGMFAIWAVQNRNFSGSDFICRVSGVLPAYLTCLYLAQNCNKITSSSWGIVYYVASIPIVMPSVFGIGYFIAWYVIKLLKESMDTQ